MDVSLFYTNILLPILPTINVDKYLLNKILPTSTITQFLQTKKTPAIIKMDYPEKELVVNKKPHH